MPIRGLDGATVRTALEDGTPLPGGRGFGGTVDGQIVTDVLGRVPVFLDRDATSIDPEQPGQGWGFDPESLSDPVAMPPGSRMDLQQAPLDAGVESATRWATVPTPAPNPSPIDAVETAVRTAIDETPSAPVAFSGGVDSAAIAARTDGPLYVAGVPGSHDPAAATQAAAWLDRSVTTIDLSPERIEALVPSVAAVIGRTNPMDLAIALPIYAVAERVAEDGADAIVLGQGADELFGGYEKVVRAPDDPRVEASTVGGARREMIQTLPGQLERDVRAIRAAGLKPLVPYLDDAVIDAALSVPEERLVEAEVGKKAPLRRATRSWLPDPIAFRKKTAVQYGSDVADELDRLARQDGFKPRQDNHVTQYIESRCETDGDQRAGD